MEPKVNQTLWEGNVKPRTGRRGNQSADSTRIFNTNLESVEANSRPATIKDNESEGHIEFGSEGSRKVDIVNYLNTETKNDTKRESRTHRKENNNSVV